MNSEHKEHNKLNKRDYLKNIDKTITYVLDNGKYADYNKVSYNRLRLSLILSILNGSPIYYRLNDEEKAYLPLLIQSFKRMVNYDIPETKDIDL